MNNEKNNNTKAKMEEELISAVSSGALNYLSHIMKKINKNIEYENMDFDQCKNILKCNVMDIKFMNDIMKNNEELCRFALFKNGNSLQFMSDGIKKIMKNYAKLQPQTVVNL